jgi:hypothetical protein
MFTRWLPLLFVLLPGCAEVVLGPRVVHYTPDRFYIRNVPVVETWPTVSATELATIVCARSGRRPLLEDEEQFNPIDIRYSTFRCVTQDEAKPMGGGDKSAAGGDT